MDLSPRTLRHYINRPKARAPWLQRHLDRTRAIFFGVTSGVRTQETVRKLFYDDHGKRVAAATAHTKDGELRRGVNCKKSVTKRRVRCAWVDIADIEIIAAARAERSVVQSPTGPRLNGEATFSVADVSEVTRISRIALRARIRKGKVRAEKQEHKGPRGIRGGVPEWWIPQSEVDRLLQERKGQTTPEPSAEIPPATPTAPQAAAAILTPREEDDAAREIEPKPRRGGRTAVPLTKEIGQFCYEERKLGRSQHQIAVAIEKRFGKDKRPKNPEQVSTYAYRYAKKEGLKWPLK